MPTKKKLSRALPVLREFAAAIERADVTGIVTFREEENYEVKMTGPDGVVDAILTAAAGENTPARIENNRPWSLFRRDLADAMTLAGHGEFFDLEINLATFGPDYVAPVERAIAA